MIIPGMVVIHPRAALGQDDAINPDKDFRKSVVSRLSVVNTGVDMF